MLDTWSPDAGTGLEVPLGESGTWLELVDPEGA